MIKKIKENLIGERIVLKMTKPDIFTANTIFKAVDENREHLRPWLPWERETKRVEDSLKYLFDKEKDFKESKKIEYGIYLNEEYIGNIGVFNIDKNEKSAEIGYWLSLKFTRNGYTTEAVKIIEKEFFSKGLNRIQIKCDEENIASSKLAEKCDYILEGKSREDSYSNYFKKFRNTLIFSKIKADFEKEK